MKIRYREQVAGEPQPRLPNTQEVEAWLAACPMCRQDGHQVLKVLVVAPPWDVYENRAASGKWAVECGNCGCLMANYTTAAWAVAGWNNGRRGA